MIKLYDDSYAQFPSIGHKETNANGSGGNVLQFYHYGAPAMDDPYIPIGIWLIIKKSEMSRLQTTIATTVSRTIGGSSLYNSSGGRAKHFVNLKREYLDWIGENLRSPVHLCYTIYRNYYLYYLLFDDENEEILFKLAHM